MNFKEYAEKAINRFGLSGYNNLAREIGITKCSMSMFRNGKATPSDETMMKLTDLAGVPKETALIDLNLWRSEKNPELKKVWLNVSKMIRCIVFLCLFFSNLAYANTISTPVHNVYYVYKRKIKPLFLLKNTFC